MGVTFLYVPMKVTQWRVSTRCWRPHLEKHLQVYDAPTQGLAQVEDGVLDGVLLGVQVQDLLVQRGRGHDDVVDVVVLRLVLHLLQGLAQLLVLPLQQVDVPVHLGLDETWGRMNIRRGKNIWMWYWDVEGRLSHHFLVQSGDHLLQLLVAFLQVLLCSLQGVQLCLSSVHLLLHPPAQLVAHSRDQGRTDRVLPDGAISVRAWRESIEEAEWATQKRLGLMHVCFNIYLFRSGSLILILRFFHYSYIIFYIIWFHFLHFTYGWQLMSVGNMELPLSLHHSSLCKWADTHGCPERYSLESALQMSELIQPCDLSSLRANTKYRRRLKPILPFTARNTFWASNVTVGHLATVSKPSIKVKILNVNCHVLNRHPSNT